MKYGFTSTTFRQIKNLDKIIEIGKNSKVDCIEWGGDIHVKDVATAKYVQKQCEKNNIDISSYGAYYKIGSNDMNYFNQICAIADGLNAKTIRVWLGTKNSEVTSKDEYENLVSDAQTICSIAENHNLIVAPECHNKTFNNNADAFVKIKNDIDCENFKTYFQSLYKDLDYDKYRIKTTINDIANVHISYSEQTREQLFKVNKEHIPQLIKQLCDCNYDGNILLEYTYFAMAKYFATDIEKLRMEVNKWTIK